MKVGKDGDVLREIHDKLFPKDRSGYLRDEMIDKINHKINSDSLNIHLNIDGNLRYNDYHLEDWILQLNITSLSVFNRKLRKLLDVQENKINNCTIKELTINHCKIDEMDGLIIDQYLSSLSVLEFFPFIISLSV